MRCLLDECIPRQFARALHSVSVSHVYDEGWAGLRNGALLRAMQEGGFTHFVTVDRNLAFQQNLAQSDIAVIILQARTNRVVDLLPLAEELLDLLPRVRPGHVARLGA